MQFALCSQRWMFSGDSTSMTDDAKSESEKNELAKLQQRDWAGLPYDLLCLILKHLFIDDITRFHYVCKAWELTPIPSIQSPINFPGVQSQWLMCVGNDTVRYKLFHPIYKEPYVMDIPELSGAVLRFSKDGWLLMSRGQFSVFFFNPFTKALINLPDLPYEGYQFRGITFTSSPTLSDCLVFGMNSCYDEYVHISTIRRGEENWKIRVFGCNLPIYISHCNPVFQNEKFYCLGEEGKLGVFDPEKEDWRVYEIHQQPDDVQQSFLVECNGELLSVFMGFMGKWISVFKLDKEPMAWKRVESLGDQMLFVSKTTSFSAKKIIKGMGNKIYLARIQGKCGVLYSLASGLYQTFGNDYSRKDDLYMTGEPLYSCWIEPKVQTYSNQELNWLAI